MLKPKKVLAVALASASIWGMSLAPALAIEPSDYDVVAVESVDSRSMLTLSEIISFRCGVKLKVVYTYNDAYGTITGIQSSTLYYRPSDVYSPTWTYQRLNGGKSYRFTLRYALHLQRAGFEPDRRPLGIASRT